MQSPELFASPISKELDESIRVDRDPDHNERLALLADYRITEEAHAFLLHFFRRAAGQQEAARMGNNSWLYGYYGSGKSHLLHVLGLLLDSGRVEQQREQVWETFSDQQERELLRKAWVAALDSSYFAPLFVNLLKYQGRRRRSFGDILLQAAHQKGDFSPQRDVAFFEKWYQPRQPDNEKREKQARQILKEAGISLPEDEVWPCVQQYQVLAEVVLPRLFEQETGVVEGLRDVTDRDLNPEFVAKELEAWREELAAEKGRPVKLLLLLDEVSLLVGTDSGLLNELNAFAEAVDEVGKGNMLSVATAQESLTEERADYAAKKVDFTILHDRFPHQYSLPSRHVGQIVAGRLLDKTAEGEEKLDELIQSATVQPADALVYEGVQQNTSPRLNELTTEEVVRFFPLLPYHPPLFLEILASLRTQKTDRSKSIFSGTARAVLAIVKALLEEWQEKGKTSCFVNLVDFFEVVRPELEEIIPNEIETIGQIEKAKEEGTLQPTDVDVCKAVLLLQYVPNMVPLSNPQNIAVAIMRDMNGRTRTAKANEVSEALERLTKYIRKNEGAGPALRFTTQDERHILESAEDIERHAGWEDLITEVEGHLWEDVLLQLDLAEQIAYPTEDDAYPVSYSFTIDGHVLERPFGAEEGLDVSVYVAGLVSDELPNTNDHLNKLIWTAAEKGRQPVREAIRSWAALKRACRGRRVPPSIEQEMEERSQKLPSDVARLLRHGKLKVRSRKPSTTEKALQHTLRINYDPKYFHPEMTHVDASMLPRLRRVSSGEELPEWAKKIEVSYDSTATLEGFDIRTSVRSLVGRMLNKHDELSLDRLLDLVTGQKALYKTVRPALVAIIWGLCRRGDFRPVRSSGDPLPTNALLDEHQWGDVRLRIAGMQSLREHLEQLDFVNSGDTLNDALVDLERHLQRAKQGMKTLQEDVRALQETLLCQEVSALLDEFVETLEQKTSKLDSVVETIDAAAGGPNWGEVIKQTQALRRWHHLVQHRWEQRQSYFLQLDGQLELTRQTLPWVGERSREAVAQLRSQTQAAATVAWWEEDEWQTLTDTLSARSEVLEELRKAWSSFATENKRSSLLGALRDHPWMQPVTELPSHVGSAFRQEYLDPLRQYAASFRQSEGLMNPLTGDLAEVNEKALQRALGLLIRGGSFAILEEERTHQLAEKLERLNGAVESRTPQDVGGVGLWPKDGARLQQLIASSAQRKKLSVSESDRRVVIR